MTNYINTANCWIPVPIELIDNYKVWERSHYPENFFKFYPVTDKKLYTDVTYRLLSHKIGNRISGFIATLIRIAILQTGIFSDPEHECIMTMSEARRVVKGLPDSWTTPDSTNQAFVRVTKCIHDHATEIIHAAIAVQLNRGLHSYSRYAQMLSDLSVEYGIEPGCLHSGILTGIHMLNYNGFVFLLALFEDIENLSTYDDIVDSLKQVPNDFINYQPYGPIVCKTSNPADQKRQKKLERTVYHEFRRYQRQYDRYLKRRKRFHGAHENGVARPVMPAIFMYIDYVKFKYKGEIVYL